VRSQLIQGVGPEIDENYLAAQVRCRQLRGIEPASVAVEARQVTSMGKSAIGQVALVTNR
jgi:hypothetical protein